MLYRHVRTGFFILFLLSIFFVPFPAAAQPDKALPYYIQWDHVDGAGGYTIEVQNLNGEPVFNEQLPATDNDILLDLPPGMYKFRILTLNKFLRFENATSWVSIEILTLTAPNFIKISPVSITTGTPLSFTLQADRMLLDMSVYLIAPNGDRSRLTITKIKNNTFRLTGASLTERGKYTLELTNPPDLVTRKTDLLFVQYPEPVVTKIDPTTLIRTDETQDTEPKSLEITGELFSSEAIIRLQADAITKDSESSSMILPIRKNEPNKIIVMLPPTLPAGNYTVQIANASDIPVKTAGTLIVSAPIFPQTKVSISPEKKVAPNSEKNLSDISKKPEEKIQKEKTFHNWLSLSGGLGENFLSGAWKNLYTQPTLSGNIFSAFYVTNNLRPLKGHSFDFSIGLDADISEFQNDDTTIYVESALRDISLLVCPALTISFPLIRIRTYIGGGLNYFSLSSKTPLGNTVKDSSLDPAICTGMLLEYPFSNFLAAGLGGQFACVFNPEPFYKYSVLFFVSTLIPIKW